MEQYKDIIQIPSAEAVLVVVDDKQKDVINSKPGYGEGIVTIGKHEIIPWGATNRLPQETVELVSKNHIKPKLLETERDFLMGNRLVLTKERIENGKSIFDVVKDSEIEDWADEVNLAKYWMKTCTNYIDTANTLSIAEISSKTMKISSLIAADILECRKGKIINGETRTFYTHPTWKSPVQSEIKSIPAYDRSKEIRKQLIFGYWHMNEKTGQSYYSYPAWWGTSNWTQISNLIPSFHLSGLKNGYNIKYIIKVPYMQFLKMTGGSEDPQKIAEAKAQVSQEMSTMLSGQDNVNKNILLTKYVDNNAREIPGWEIIPLDNKNTDEQYIKLDEHANINQASGHGIDPSLAGIDTGRGLGKSGSELRLTYQVHLALRTPQQRQISLEFLNSIVMKVNGWKDKGLRFSVEDMDLTTLDVNKTGMQPQPIKN